MVNNMVRKNWFEIYVMCIHSVAGWPYTNMINRTVNENNKGRNDATYIKIRSSGWEWWFLNWIPLAIHVKSFEKIQNS